MRPQLTFCIENIVLAPWDSRVTVHGGKIYIGMSNCMQLYTDFSSSESFWGESVDVKLACGFSANHGTQTIMAAS